MSKSAFKIDKKYRTLIITIIPFFFPIFWLRIDLLIICEICLLVIWFLSNVWQQYNLDNFFGSVRKNMDSIYSQKESGDLMEIESGFYRGRYIKYYIENMRPATVFFAPASPYSMGFKMYFKKPRRISKQTKMMCFLGSRFRLFDDKIEHDFHGLSNQSSIRRLLDKIYRKAIKIESAFPEYSSSEIIEFYSSGKIGTLPPLLNK